MHDQNKLLAQLSTVSKTLLIPLYCRAIESQSNHPIISDPWAVSIVKEINPILLQSEHQNLRLLARKNPHHMLSIILAMRARRFDRYVTDFLKAHSQGTVVSMGCGLDSRFHRTNNGSVHWFDLDFPEVLTFKRIFLQEEERYHFLASSLLDFSWMEVVKNSPGPYLFLAEGVFMYLQPEEVRSIVLQLQTHFPGCELVFETANRWVVHPLLQPCMRFKFKYQLHLGDILFHFGLSEAQELETWGTGIEFLDEWTYFDEQEKKMGIWNIGRYFNWIKKTQWLVHYHLN